MRIYKAIDHIWEHIRGIPIRGKQSGNVRVYVCPGCKYESNRQYNVLRHQQRIHTTRKLHICCGTRFFTKGDYYVHCEQLHPQTRSNAIMSKIKYKITSESLALEHREDHRPPEQTGGTCNMQLRSRYSSRIRMTKHAKRTRRKVSVEYSLTCSDFDIENIPLISFLTDRRLMLFLKRCYSTNDANEIVKSGSEQSSSVRFAISSSERNIEQATVSGNGMENNVRTTAASVPSCSHELPTKKLILRRFRSSVMHEYETRTPTPLRQRNRNGSDPENFEMREIVVDGDAAGGRQSRNQNSRCGAAAARADKENVSTYSFSLEEQLNITLDSGIAVPLATQLHRDFLSAIDFDRYKIF